MQLNKLSRVGGWGWVAGEIGNKAISASNQVEVEVEVEAELGKNPATWRLKIYTLLKLVFYPEKGGREGYDKTISLTRFFLHI